MLPQNQRFRRAASRPEIHARLTLSIAFSENDVVYFTSHNSLQRPSGVDGVDGCIKSFNGGTQKLDARNASSSIGSISFELTDLNGEVSAILANRNAAGVSINKKVVRVYYGYGETLVDNISQNNDDDIKALEALDWVDYSQHFTMIIDGYSTGAGTIHITASDIQREELSDLFDIDTTTLLNSLTDSQTHIPCPLFASPTQFQTLLHDSKYSHRPGERVGYIKINEEIICHSGIVNHDTLGPGFAVVERGCLNTLAVAHEVDASASDDRKTLVREYVYLEGPALKLLYALQTGKLYGQGAEVLPEKWHHGISESLVKLDDYLNADPLLCHPPSNTGRTLIFRGLQKVSGKKFIEEEILRFLGGIRPVYANGAIGFKKLSSVLSDADYVLELNNENLVRVGELTHQLKHVVNDITIAWNYSDIKQEHQIKTRLFDSGSAQKYGLSDPLQMLFLGVKSTASTDQEIRHLFDSYRNRYAGGGLYISCEALPEHNNLEVGDNVFLNTHQITDPLTGTHLNRVFEIQQITPNFQNGRSKLSLFASADAAGDFAPIAANHVLSDDFYTGPNLGSAFLDLNATFAAVSNGVINSDITLNGGNTLGDRIFYHDGDLLLPAGVTITINKNVQLRIKGRFTRNGNINDKGRGHPGGQGGHLFSSNGLNNIELGVSSGSAIEGVQTDADEIATNEGAGRRGYLGACRAANYLMVQGAATVDNGSVVHRSTIDKPAFFLGYKHAPKITTVGFNSSANLINLVNRDGSNLEGIENLDLMGTSGPGGRPLIQTVRLTSLNGLHEIVQNGADGGASGAGLVIICRGETVGVNSTIDLSGNDGGFNTTLKETLRDNTVHYRVSSGGGGGGAPGAYYLLIDGPGSFGTSSQNVTQVRGLAGINPNTNFYGGETFGRHFPPNLNTVAYPVNYGRSLDAQLDLQESGFKVQYIPETEALSEQQPDAENQAVRLNTLSFIQLVSGTETLLPSADGAIRERVRVTWGPLPSQSLATGYELQAREVGQNTDWRTIALIRDKNSTTTFFDVTEGVTYVVRVRVMGSAALTIPSHWLESGAHEAEGKSEPPPTPTGFAARTSRNQGIVFTVDPSPVPDFHHFRIYRDVETADAEIMRGDFIQAIWDEPSPGLPVYIIKAVDRTGNISEGAQISVEIVGPKTPITTIEYQNADVVFSWTAQEGSFATDKFIIKTSNDILLSEQKSTTFRYTFTEPGAKQFEIYHVDIAGNLSAPSVININPIPPSPPRVTTQVIDNSILFRVRVNPGSFPVLENRWYRSHTALANPDYETMAGTATSENVPEQEAGTFTYRFYSVDTAGNQSQETTAQATVSEPPGFVFLNKFSESEDGWPGRKAGCYVEEDNTLIMPVVIGESWEEHFEDAGFDSPDEQIQADLPFYLQPSPSTSTYEKKIDLGAVVSQSLITINVDTETIFGSSPVTIELFHSELENTGETAAPSDSRQVFATNFRFLRIKINFGNSSLTDIVKIKNLTVTLTVRTSVDSGSGVASASDINGTPVLFNKNFLSAQTPTASFSSSPLDDHFYIIDYDGGANPTGFNIYFFDRSTGQRINKNFDWRVDGTLGA